MSQFCGIGLGQEEAARFDERAQEIPRPN